jgi:putative inorganic carbon (HCO3(-)) transporter
MTAPSANVRQTASSALPSPIRDIASLILLTAFSALLALIDGGLPAYGLVVAALLVSLASPAAAVASIGAAVPFIHDPVAIGGSSWSLLELSILFAALSVGLRLALDMMRSRSLRPAIALTRPFPTSIAALALVIVGVASLLTVADPRYRPDSVRELRWVIVEPIVALVLFRWAISRGQRGLILVSLIGTGTAVALVGLLQLATGNGVVIADGVERATGPYNHPNNLALYLDRIAILALALSVCLPARRRLLVPIAFVTGLGLAATLSRGAALAYLVGACWVVAAARIRHGWRWIGAGAVIAFALLAIVATQRLTDSGSSGATSSRELIWSSSIDMIQDHPITGVGLDQFLNQYRRRYVEPAGWPERYTSHPHNLVLDFWLRLGLAGLVCLATLVGIVVRLASRGWSLGGNAPIWIGATGALLAGATHGLLDNGFFLPDLAILTWLMVALLESAVGKASDDRFG